VCGRASSSRILRFFSFISSTTRAYRSFPKQGRVNHPRHVIGCHVTQQTRGYSLNALDDAASSIRSWALRPCSRARARASPAHRATGPPRGATGPPRGAGRRHRGPAPCFPAADTRCALSPYPAPPASSQRRPRGRGGTAAGWPRPCARAYLEDAQAPADRSMSKQSS